MQPTGSFQVDVDQPRLFRVTTVENCESHLYYSEDGRIPPGNRTGKFPQPNSQGDVSTVVGSFPSRYARATILRS